MISLGKQGTYESVDTSEIQVEDLRKSYGSVTALDGITTSFASGSIHGLVGPNGSGKSTLFKIFLRLTPPSSGTVTSPSPERIGYAFQRPQFYPNLSVEENLSVFTKLHGNVDSEWIKELKDVLRLDRVEHQSATDLSGGFAKKLDVALAFLNQPDIVLLDEPLSDVDKVSRNQLKSFLTEYCTENRLIIISTHNLEEFGDTFDEKTVLYDGELREEY